MQNSMIILMNSVERMTVSLPEKSVAFVNEYKQKMNLKSNSQVVVEALKLLEQQSLYDMFGEMAKEDNTKTVAGSQKAAEDFLDESW